MGILLLAQHWSHRESIKPVSGPEEFGSMTVLCVVLKAIQFITTLV